MVCRHMATMPSSLNVELMITYPTWEAAYFQTNYDKPICLVSFVGCPGFGPFPEHQSQKLSKPWLGRKGGTSWQCTWNSIEHPNESWKKS